MEDYTGAKKALYILFEMQRIFNKKLDGNISDEFRQVLLENSKRTEIIIDDIIKTGGGDGSHI